ncbi:hypothetical protein Cpap_1460 [Ruminiclostridium papyrosolvens DSM 2782]|uniref:Uncharacterized protein n=1 Tax=Ruminiclostridium papyrosolvens DSM 2782 TaxID=588581 RepID=F1TEA2_9FIRM|nr:hypothetical protein [Ruminiclostridium papyrosolvens]EGD47068.1 hypothetical protein Cpap_1460 [Ruminiclostridium papyrosolvens DSM 2782]WES36009.1 hypothetical protein P0092_08625 [Ruminiclostridium papyrosolvens DSM 2782]WES36107.1 hypothetical protein P0092_09125 [Ruminiclostridium papyrosolvens DSM 2782]
MEREKTNIEILNENFHSIITEILNRFDFNKTSDIEELTKSYCDQYLEVRRLVKEIYTPEPTKLTIKTLKK